MDWADPDIHCQRRSPPTSFDFRLEDSADRLTSGIKEPPLSPDQIVAEQALLRTTTWGFPVMNVL